jgi:hypothetical protein
MESIVSTVLLATSFVKALAADEFIGIRPQRDEDV